MTAPNTNANTAATTGEPSSSAAPTTPEPWKAGQHSRFAGRSPEEILGIAEAQAEMLAKFNQPIPAPPPPPQNRFDMDLPDDEYIQGRDVKRILQQVQNQPMPNDPVARAQSAGALFMSIQQAHPDAFKRWGQEIRNEAAKLPIEHWNLDTLSQIVRIVRSNHVDELIAEKAQQLASEAHPTIRSGSGGSGGGPQTHDSVFETGDPTLLAHLRDQGIRNEADLERACQGTGITPSQFIEEFKKYGNGAVIRG